MSRNLSEQMKLKCESVDSEIIKYIGEPDERFPELFDSMCYSASAGGKRLRPVFTLAFAELFGAKEEAALPFACAVELVHTYSLIHDDLPCMDDDDMRRGKPTNHKVYGEATALLAGDALLTAAFEVLASNAHVPAEISLMAVRLLSNCAGRYGMIGGQQLDLICEAGGRSYDDMVYMQQLKTGKLISAACLLGCLAAGVCEGDERYDAASVYARSVGLAFQIEDDILDRDQEEKSTFLSFMSEVEAIAEIDRLTDTAVSAISKYPGCEFLCELAESLKNRRK